MTGSLLIRDYPVQPNATRMDLAHDLVEALTRGHGFAVGKIGVAEQAMLSYPLLLSRCSSPSQVAALTVQTRRHCAAQLGIFPTDTDALLHFCEFHAAACRTLDFLGLVGGKLEADLLEYLPYRGRTLSIMEMEPDRSIPDRSEACYLPVLRGKRVLIISSMATLLQSRATRETFEAVWSRTHKSWFYPEHVTSLQFPYTYDIDTQRRFGSSMNLLEWIIDRIDPREFDIALIAGASLGIPIASAIKRMDRSAIALGGALQVLFGVRGKRWRENLEWRQNYFTDAWVDTPPDMAPRTPPGYADDGAYW